MFSHVVCPNCNTTNRLPENRLNESPTCGRCHESIFAGKALRLNSANFERHLVKNDIPLLVDFWAPWCGPCRMMAPAFEQAAQQLEPNFRLAKVDTEAEPMLAARYAIRSIPTLVLFMQGREVARQSGALSVTDITRWVRAQANSTQRA